MEVFSTVSLYKQVVMVLGVMGACRGDELTNLLTDNVEDRGNEIIVTIPNTKTKRPKLFQIDGQFADIIREYSKLRPANVPTKRFCLQFRNGTCTKQVMGKNTIAKVAKEVAKYLGLPDSASYTGHGFRRTSTTILANTGVGIEMLKRHGMWKSNTVCEGYIQESLAQKRKIGHLISDSINQPSTSKDDITEEKKPKRTTTSMSFSVESSSQILLSKEESFGVVSSVASSNGLLGAKSGGAVSLSKPINNATFPFNKENIVFNFTGPITNFNVNMKE